MTELKVNSQILVAIGKPGGAYGPELAVLSPSYREDLAAMQNLGIPVRIGTDKEGRRFAYLEALPGQQVPPAPAAAPARPEAPPSAAPPADAPPARPAPPPKPETAKPAAPPAPPEEPREYDVRFTANDYRVQSRPGAMPRITLAPEGPASAQAALLFSTRHRRGEILDVYLRIRHAPREAGPAEEKKPAAPPAPRREEPPRLADLSIPPDAILSPPPPPPPPPEPTKEATMPLYEYECPTCGTIYQELQPLDAAAAPCPKCGTGGERLVSAPAPAIVKGTERDPEKKSKAQLSQEIDEQVRDNELPPDLADAQARLAGL